MELIIRDAIKQDMAQVYQLIMELAQFEKMPDAVQLTIADLERDGFGKRPLFHCFLAQVGTHIVGIALVYPRYSTWRGPVIHLEDLIVTQHMRGKGIGTALLRRVVAYGLEKKVRRIGWDVLDWNEPAITFYKNAGAVVLSDWDIVQMDEGAMQKFLEK